MKMMDKRRKILFAAAAGAAVSFCYTGGALLEQYESLDLTEGTFYLKWLLWGVAASLVLYGLWEAADRYGEKIAASARLARIRFPLPAWLCVLILLLCWLPAWLSIFPGAFAYDAYDEWMQVRNHRLTSHHPVIHVLLLGGLTEGFHGLTGSYNVGIGVYTFLQMVLLSFLLTRTLAFMKEFSVPDFFCWIALLFYALSPVMQLFAVSATKDVLFSAFQLLFLQDLIRISCRREAFFASRRRLLSFGLTAFFTMTLRNNGFYIVLGTLAVLIWVCRCYWKKLAPVLLGIGVAYALYVGPCYSMLHVTGGSVAEMLSVPIQQMARVHQYDYESLEQEELELLYRMIPRENLERYRASVADFVKEGFRQEEFRKNTKEFFSLWLKWGKNHLLTYVNSFLINTVDFWYPNAVVDGYRDAYGRSCYFDYRVSEPGEEIVLLPRLHRYYEAISSDLEIQKLPFLFLVLSPGWYLMITMLLFADLWRRRLYTFLAPGMMFVLSLVTVLLGPVALVRYVLIFYYAFPVLLPLALYPGWFTGNQPCRAI